jgi:hypothetical protein
MVLPQKPCKLQIATDNLRLMDDRRGCLYLIMRGKQIGFPENYIYICSRNFDALKI